MRAVLKGVPVGADIRAQIRELARQTELPRSGAGWSDPDAAWMRVVGQICAVGSSRCWEALGNPGVREELSVPRIRAAGAEAEAHVHRVLARIGVRYCSPTTRTSAKAAAIAANAHSPSVAGADDEIRLLRWLREQVGEPERGALLSTAQAREARRALIRELRFFGPKSASDFLLGLGLADTVIAFDVRILNLLIDYLGWSPASRRLVGNLTGYEKLEAAVAGKLADPAGMSLLELDRVLFQHYAHLQQLWKNGRAGESDE